MFLLAALIANNSHILARIYFIFLKNILDQSWKAFNAQFGPHWKNWENSYQVKHILAPFCELITLILG